MGEVKPVASSVRKIKHCYINDVIFRPFLGNGYMKQNIEGGEYAGSQNIVGNLQSAKNTFRRLGGLQQRGTILALALYAAS